MNQYVFNVFNDFCGEDSGDSNAAHATPTQCASPLTLPEEAAIPCTTPDKTVCELCAEEEEATQADLALLARQAYMDPGGPTWLLMMRVLTRSVTQDALLFKHSDERIDHLDGLVTQAQVRSPDLGQPLARAMYERAMRDNEIVAVLLEGIKQLDNLLVVYGKRMAAEAEQS